nr:hypothetical protein [Tanacetum cinerariifolium]
MAVTVAFGGGGDMGVVAARDGEWGEGSSRSGGGEHFWVLQKCSPEKFFGGGGRRWWLTGGGGRRLKKTQEKDKIRQKREAWRSWEKLKAVTVDRARKTE